MKAKSRMKKMTNGDMEVTKVASADEEHMVAQEKTRHLPPNQRLSNNLQGILTSQHFLF